MKTAIWLYLFIFVAFFDLHAQYPILSPFALSLGATPSFIGLILGVYSITHLPGNLLAGYGVDRYGSKKFLVVSLIAAGFLLIFQARVTAPWELLVIRSISGFVLAFLSPACLAMLAKIARDQIHQGKLMSGNGLVHTLASVVSPAAGAVLVAKFGFTASFSILGWGLVATGILAIFGLKEPGVIHEKEAVAAVANVRAQPEAESIPWLFFLIPLGMSCAQGILFFELPLMQSVQASILTSGILFSLVSLGALLTLSLLFLNRYSAYIRTLLGCLGLAMIFFGMSVNWSIPLYVSLFLIGMAKGIILPSISTLLANITSRNRYGRAFSLLSIAFSIGAFLGPILAGQLRLEVSPYFIAFLSLMIGITLLPLGRIRPAIST
ncbi:drug efflux system protein MdtG [Chlamydia abortus]|uniref:MFS transporter n=1 Tax=Paenibacillus residui TaxID=629724 RepID=A0ABW3D477_9BACL|nr:MULTISPECIES: MFS transporter [Paenibacillaceae]SHE13199.1 drug efflux system protein MdtG [Chlamydia abortus]